jgi:hypothetical protein
LRGSCCECDRRRRIRRTEHVCAAGALASTFLGVGGGARWCQRVGLFEVALHLLVGEGEPRSLCVYVCACEDMYVRMNVKAYEHMHINVGVNGAYQMHAHTHVPVLRVACYE